MIKKTIKKVTRKSITRKIKQPNHATRVKPKLVKKYTKIEKPIRKDCDKLTKVIGIVVSSRMYKSLEANAKKAKIRISAYIRECLKGK